MVGVIKWWRVRRSEWHANSQTGDGRHERFEKMSQCEYGL